MLLLEPHLKPYHISPCKARDCYYVAGYCCMKLYHAHTHIHTHTHTHTYSKRERERGGGSDRETSLSLAFSLYIYIDIHTHRLASTSQELLVAGTLTESLRSPRRHFFSPACCIIIPLPVFRKASWPSVYETLGTPPPADPLHVTVEII